MDPIIDAHSHLGDILNPGGGALIGRTGVTKERVYDPTSASERDLHRGNLVLDKIHDVLMRRWITRADRARCFTATYENFRVSMEESGITYSVCLPIPPNVSFSDLAPFAERDPAVIPFTGVDYSRDEHPGPALAADVAAGARGLKLHPIIQLMPLTSARTRAAVEVFSRHRLPVLFHCGISSYYLGRERRREKRRYGAIHYAVELVESFPEVPFIAGHAGLVQVDEVMRKLGRFRNLWVDTSFQSVKTVRKLIATFGPERVLFASDWPFGNRPPALEIVKAACRGDAGMERRILYENAAELLGIG